MFKKKIISSILIGALAFTTGAQSVLAGLPSVSETIEEAEDSVEKNSKAINQIIDIESSETESLLSDIFVEYIDEELVIYSDNLLQTIEVSIEESIYTSALNGNRTEVVIPLSEVKGIDTLIKVNIHNSEKQILEVDTSFNQLLQGIDDDPETTKPNIEDSKDKPVKESDKEDSVEESNLKNDIEDNLTPSEQEEKITDTVDTVVDTDRESKKNTDSNPDVLENEKSEDDKASVAPYKNSELVPEFLSNVKKVTYKTVVGASGFSLDTLPWGTEGFERIDRTNSIINYEVTVRQEANNGNYLLIERKGTLLGWVDRRALRQPQKGNAKHSKSTHYSVKIKDGKYSVDTLPWGTPGYQRLTKTSDYINQEVTAVRVSNNKEYFLLENKQGKLIGWVDHRALTPIADRIASGKDVSYEAVVGVGGFTIDTLPWGTSGYKRIDNTQAYENQKVKIIQETKNGQYLLLSQNDRLIGWVDRRSMRLPQIGNSKLSSKVYYDTEIIRGNYTLDSLPWGTPGYQRLDSSKNHIGKKVKAVRQTKNGHYILVEKDNNLLGWIDHRALQIKREVGMVKNAVPVEYNTTIDKGGYSLDTLPWGVKGYERIKWSHQLENKKVSVSQEYGNYVLIEQNLTSLGWIDKRALKHIPQVKSSQIGRPVKYSTSLKSGYSIDTLPWGTRGFERISNTNLHEGTKVNVIKHSGNYILAKKGNKLLGWIDKRALELPTIFIDPGHGGTDSGATGTLNGKTIYEKKLNLDVSLKLRNLLEIQGYKVLMSRESDTTVAALDRSRMANSAHADIFLSIHHNAMPKTYPRYSRVNGIESFYYEYNPNYPSKLIPESHDNPIKLAKGYDLAHQIQKGLLSETGARHRRVDDAAFLVIKEVKMPAALTELGFLTNQSELAKVVKKSYQNDLARGIFKGINKYYKK